MSLSTVQMRALRFREVQHIQIYRASKWCYFLKIIFTYLFLAVLGLHCYTSFSLVVARRGYSLVAEHGLLIAEHGP